MEVESRNAASLTADRSDTGESVPVKKREGAARGVYACLVHEAPECVIDLVRNLRYNDPTSIILLYNGGNRPRLLADIPLEALEGAIVYPKPTWVRWGYLHKFALNCIRFALENLTFDFITMIDSDQLSIRPGYSAFISRFLCANRHVGILGSAQGRQPFDSPNGPAKAAWNEVELWRPYLRKFHEGEAKFPQWTFWPGTVFSAEAALAIVERFDGDRDLGRIIQQSAIWATEEVFFPTVAALLGFSVIKSPCSHDYVRYRIYCTPAELATALSRPDAYWVHPVKRVHTDELRSTIRAYFSEYGQRADARTMVSSRLSSRPRQQAQ